MVSCRCLSRSPKAIFKQIMALQLREHLRALSPSALHDLGDRQFAVVVENRLRHAAEEIEGRHMAIAQGFRLSAGYALTKQPSECGRSTQK
jgi:hypothetical protein